DLQMQQPKEAAAEAEPEGGGTFRLERETCIVEPQAAHCIAQILEIRSINREQAAEHHRLGRFEAGQRCITRASVVGDGVTNSRIGYFLDCRREKADLTRAQLFQHLLLGTEDTN